MDRITPHLWFDTEAVEAADFYSSTFPESRVTDITTLHGTPSGDADVVSFEVLGQPFMAISAGPLFKFTPAVSFLVRCNSAGEVDELWARLSDGGNVLMPLDKYPFSERYGWTEDRYGLAWQLGYDGDARGVRGDTAGAGGRGADAKVLPVAGSPGCNASTRTRPVPAG